MSELRLWLRRRLTCVRWVRLRPVRAVLAQAQSTHALKSTYTSASRQVTVQMKPYCAPSAQDMQRAALTAASGSRHNEACVLLIRTGVMAASF